MTCPVCGSGTKIIDSGSDVDIVIRKRQCVNMICRYIFTTVELECTKSDEDSVNAMLKEIRKKAKK
jgi:transcriptional regulator NrdR family protein